MSFGELSEKEITPELLEAYIQGAWDLYMALGGDGHCKCYDPATIENTEDGLILHSYVLDLWDGGRHHNISNNRFKDIMQKAIEEFKELLDN